MAQRSTQKRMEEIKEAMSKGDFYEAHQMYRTVARRYTMKQQEAKAIRVLYEGAAALFKAEQPRSASDLARYMLEIYQKAGTPVDAESLGRVVELLSLYPSQDQDRKPFINESIKWSAKSGGNAQGDIELQDYIGTLFYREGNMNLAMQHLLCGTDHSATLLGELAAKSQQEDTIADIVLRLLATKNIHHAELVINGFARHASTSGTTKFCRTPAGEPIEVPVFTSRWANFAHLVLLTVQRDAKALFVELKTNYRALWQSSEAASQLEDIGFVFFGIPRPPKAVNPLQEMMKSLFAGPAPSSPSQPRLELD